MNCTKCGSQNLRNGSQNLRNVSHQQTTGLYIYQNVECGDCGQRYTEVYRMEAVFCKAKGSNLTVGDNILEPYLGIPQ